MPTKATIERKHPDFPVWVLDETRQRASYIATRRHLARYLVPHRFEGSDTKPEGLDRAMLGYGLGLNKAWLYEILGHVRGAPRVYSWGPLGENEESAVEPLEGSPGALLWGDATRSDRTWSNFWHRDVLEWMLTSPGALVVCDAVQGEVRSKQDEQAGDVRAYVRIVPLSQMEDAQRSDTGFQWVKLTETVDNRNPYDDDGAIEVYKVYYVLNEKGETVVSRFNEEGTPVKMETRDGKEVDDLNLGVIRDKQGIPCLPIVEAFYGEHPDVPWIGSGLLLGLDEIAIDLYNTITEVREGYRDAAFAMWVYRGSNFPEVLSQFEGGARLTHVGDVETDDLNRVAGDASEVDAGLKVVEFGLRAWAVSAKRKAEEATERASVARSGVSLQAEFQLDLRPLLVEVANALDEAESRAMLILAQLADKNVKAKDAATVGVVRDDEFQLEDEASRITRIVGEFLDQVAGLPSEVLTPITMKWLEEADLFDLDEEIEIVGGNATRREVVEAAISRASTSQDRQAEQGATLGAFLGGGGV